MRRIVALCAACLFLCMAMVAPAMAASPVHAVTDADKVDLTDALHICAGPADPDILEVAAGACPFEPATEKNLSRGFSNAVFWLRLTLANASPAPVERLLMVGHRRLERASFFEYNPQGGWTRSEAGLSVPLAERAYLSPDPILPVRLEPGESRTFYIRATSRTSINLTTTLWRERAFLDARNRAFLEQAAGIGGILVAAAFSLLMAAANFSSQWSNRANLYLGAALLSKAAFDASIAGFIPLYVLAPDQSYDVRIQAVSLALTAIFFALFITHFVDAQKNYRVFHWIFRALIVCLLAAAGWAVFIAFGRAFQLMALTGMAVIICSVALLARAWRDKLPAAGFLLVSTAINTAVLLHRVVLAFGGGHYNDTLLFAYSWMFMLTTPLLPLGIALHERTLHRALESARKENVARLAFLAQMSHELRTPLDTILGNAQLLSRPGTSPSLMAEGLAAIQDSGRRLLRMIDDILDHARGLAGKLAIRPAPVDWPAFLRGVAFSAQSVAARQGNEFILRQYGPAIQTLRLDEGRLRQILDNLIVNAARHTRGGRIILSCGVIPEDDNFFLLDLSVADTGEGVAPEDRERIFLPFERGGAKNSRRGDKGLGMGLTISRQLAQMMGGRLTLQSEPGRGACFRFQVRTTAAEDTQKSVALASGLAASGRTALLVDDEDDNRHVLATFLRGSGFGVLEAASGSAALALMEAEGEIDIVLTDQFMAAGDGWMVLQAARRLRPDIPVVSISAAPLERPAGMQATFDASFMKPLDQANLLQGMADLLGLDVDGANKTPAAGPPAEGAPARPNAADMEVLRGLIGTGQVSEIMAWAEARKKIDPACGPFADAIWTAARRLDFNTLNALAEAKTS